MLATTNGRMSLEGMLGFLKSVERPERLNAKQIADVRNIVNNLLMDNSPAGRSHIFDRVVRPCFTPWVTRTSMPGLCPTTRRFRSCGERCSLKTAVAGMGSSEQGISAEQNGDQSGLFLLSGKSANSVGGPQLPIPDCRPACPKRYFSRLRIKWSFRPENNLQNLRINLDPPDLGPGQYSCHHAQQPKPAYVHRSGKRHGQGGVGAADESVTRSTWRNMGWSWKNSMSP